MANRETSIAYENLNRRIFSGVGEYGIPQIEPVAYEGGCDWIGFNYAKSTKGCTGDKQASGRCGNALSGRSEK